MRLLSNLHVKGKPAVLPDRAIRSQPDYFSYRPCVCVYIYIYIYIYIYKMYKSGCGPPVGDACASDDSMKFPVCESIRKFLK